MYLQSQMDENMYKTRDDFGSSFAKPYLGFY